MTTQIERANSFAKLHIKGSPLILYNVWDAGTAQAVRDAGASAIATGSWAVAAANGYADGESIPLDVALANLRRIVASVDLPVTLDVEGGYGRTPAEVAVTATKVIEAGAVGINFEDQIVGGEGLYTIEQQSARIEAIRAAAKQAGVPLFINARTDIYLLLWGKEHRDEHLQEAISRAQAFADAGADGFFAPGLWDATNIGKLCAVSPLPVNIMTMRNTPPNKQMASLGVARISYGAGPYRQAMEAVKQAARAAFDVN
jgi:2-methylisocitrate lyase-like PEP mutase family enzyme